MSDIKDIRLADQQVKMFLGGKMRTLCFDLNAFAELERRFGDIQAAMASLTSGRISDVKIVLWAAIIHEEVTAFDEESGEPLGYNVTPYQVAKWITPRLMPEVSQKLALLMQDDLPVQDPEEVQKQVGAQQAQPLGVNLPEGIQMAQVVPTEEEKAKIEEEAKN